MFALRGAISVDENTAPAIAAATGELCARILAENALTPADVVSAFFTATRDLDAAFPATGARAAGWTDVPMLCSHEMDVQGAPERIVRVLVTVNGDPRGRARHVYLGRAAALRPDWAAG